jgi:hypothetical protein
VHLPKPSQAAIGRSNGRAESLTLLASCNKIASFLQQHTPHQTTSLSLSMAELVAFIAGVSVPALHGLHLLVEDIKKILDAPNAIQDLRHNIEALRTSIACVLGIKQEQWEALGNKVLDQSRATIAYCNKTCDELHRRIRSCTGDQDDGKLSWREQTVIGVFKTRRIEMEVEALKSCRAEMDLTVNMATL